MNQNLGLDLSNAEQQRQLTAFGQQSAVADLAQPRFYNAQTQNSQPFTGGDVVQMIASGVGGLA